ncbi:hypothetical protein M3O57_14495 [Xanthomonas nasturtii]|nr:hypothetical protein [Xanthomonas nasturtii]MCL1531427.1 hypothetical protein [Xanthomonas nasturtii]MCL1591607.1 hypothetical protein [Xanthomonas nasturtii]
MNVVTTTTLPPLNSCMYCGKSGVDVKLTNEHVMARGLNGALLLPKSSCEDPCQKMINREIETPILRNRWLAQSRLVMGLRSYNKNSKPRMIKMSFIGVDGQRFKKDVSRNDAVAVICLPLLVPARFMIDTYPITARDGIEVRGTCDVMVHGGTLTNTSDPQAKISALCRRFRASQVDLNVQITPGELSRFLCKTAHGFHVSQRGLFPLEESPALAIMRADRTDYSNWIGSEDFSPSGDTSEMHDLSIEDVVTEAGISCTVVKIRMFGAFGVDMRYVVVTRAKGWQVHTIRDQNPIVRTGKVSLVSEI